MSLRLVLLAVERWGDLSGMPVQRDWLRKSGYLRSTKSWCGAWQLSDRGVAYLLGDECVLN